MKNKFTLALLLALTVISTLSAQDSRLVARHTVRFNTSWAPYDSAVFIYSPGTGGDYWDLINGRLRFDTTHMVGWDGTNYIPYRRIIQTFDINGRVIEKLSIQISGTNLVNDDKTTYTRDGNGNVTEELLQDWNNNAWVNSYHSLMTYDVNNNMLTQTSEYWNIGTNSWGTSYLTVYTYDNNNRMLSNVSATYNTGTSQYDSTSRHVFHYDNNGLNDTAWHFLWNSGWNINSRTTNTYNGNNINTWYLIENWVSNNWENNLQGFTLFNTNNDAAGDSSQKWNTNTNMWENYGRGTHVLDNNDNTLQYLYEYYDTASNMYIKDFIDSFTYNSFDQVTWAKRQGWDTTLQAWTGRYAFTDNHYYYELYTAGVNTVGLPVPEISLYPSPASGNINLQMSWDEPQEFTVAIYDMQGRLLRQWGEKPANEYRKNIPLQGISAGTYIVQVKGRNATVQKQFTVLH